MIKDHGVSEERQRLNAELSKMLAERLYLFARKESPRKMRDAVFSILGDLSKRAKAEEVEEAIAFAKKTNNPLLPDLLYIRDVLTSCGCIASLSSVFYAAMSESREIRNRELGVQSFNGRSSTGDGRKQ